MSPAERLEPALELSGICKYFPGVIALQGVDFTAYRGEIHALVGENGAGKSTLIGIIAGTLQPDVGTIKLAGSTSRLSGPRDAHGKGVNLVPQELLAVPELSIGRNMLLGLEQGFSTRRSGLAESERKRVQNALDQVGAEFSPSTPTSRLSPPELRLAQVARSLVGSGEVIVLDEPTAVLSESDAEHMLERLESLRRGGKTIVYVSHRLSEIVRIADRVTVLRDGEVSGHFTGCLDRSEIIARMGKEGVRPTHEESRDRTDSSGTHREALRVSGLVAGERGGAVDVAVGEGEIVAVVGVQGSGHGQFLRACAGADLPRAGEVRVGGKIVKPGSVRDAVKHGLLLVPADRRNAAIAAAMSIAANIAISSRVRRSVRRFGLRWLGAERGMAREYISRFSIRAPGPETLVGNLSGGNQQKVALSKVVEGNPRVLLVEEPTQGIDVNAKQEVRNLLVTLARDQGCAVVMATSEFEDAIGFADVIHVMRLGSLVATLDGSDAAYSEILEHALP